VVRYQIPEGTTRLPAETQAPRKVPEWSSEACLPLRAHRVKARIGLDQIADQTKISRRFLEAIENGAYDELPGGVFSTSYIRQHAAATGYSAAEILEHYHRRTAGPRDSEPPAARQPGAPWWVRFFPLG
jgi:hypothetical protein